MPDKWDQYVSQEGGDTGDKWSQYAEKVDPTAASYVPPNSMTVPAAAAIKDKGRQLLPLDRPSIAPYTPYPHYNPMDNPATTPVQGINQGIDMTGMATIPLGVEGLVSSPIKTIAGLVLGGLGAEDARRVAELSGASPDTAGLIGRGAGLGFGALGSMVEKPQYLSNLKAILSSPEGKSAAIDMLPRGDKINAFRDMVQAYGQPPAPPPPRQYDYTPGWQRMFLRGNKMVNVKDEGNIRGVRVGSTQPSPSEVMPPVKPLKPRGRVLPSGTKVPSIQERISRAESPLTPTAPEPVRFPDNPKAAANPRIPPVTFPPPPPESPVIPGGTPELPIPPVGSAPIPGATQPHILDLKPPQVGVDPANPLDWARANNSLHATLQEMALPNSPVGKKIGAGVLSQAARDVYGTEYRKLTPTEVYNIDHFVRTNGRLPVAGELPVTRPASPPPPIGQ